MPDPTPPPTAAALAEAADRALLDALAAPESVTLPDGRRVDERPLDDLLAVRSALVAEAVPPGGRPLGWGTVLRGAVRFAPARGCR